jgi:hypothetical protein
VSLGLDVYGGAILAELSLTPGITEFCGKDKSKFRQITPLMATCFGIIFISYPSRKIEQFGWAIPLQLFGQVVFPAKANLAEFWHTIGAFLVTFSVVLSPLLQKFLSYPVITWLGQISFPLYLIHGPLLRSFLKWLFYLTTASVEWEDSNGRIKQTKPRPSWWQFLYAVPIFTALLLYLAKVWNDRVEPWCAMVTKKGEDLVMGKGDVPLPIPLLPIHQDSPRGAEELI